jgi:ubiquinol-cytochrome c reductase cytochrome c1 subunit
MLRKIAITAISALTLTAGRHWPTPAPSSRKSRTWPSPIEGPFGKFDEHQLQRGLQVFTEVCSACHGLKFVPIRTLQDEGGPRLPEDQVRAYAKQFTIVDKDSGEERPRIPADNFPANTDAGAPDLSLMAKARAGFHGPYGTGISQLFNGIGGPEHIVSILTGYTGETKDEAGSTFYENTRLLDRLDQDAAAPV